MANHKQNNDRMQSYTLWIIGGVILVTLFAVALFLSRTAGDQDQALFIEADNATFVIGAVAADADESAQKNKALEPLAQYIEDNLSGTYSAMSEIGVVVAKSPAEMSRLMREDKVDIFVDSPFTAFVVARLAGAEPLVNGWRKGQEKYHSIIFTRAGGITSIHELQGKMICFEDPSSTSGYLLPKAELIDQGYSLSEKSSATDAVAPDEIGYYFAHLEEKVVGDALTGIAAACATKPTDVEGYLEDNNLSESDVQTILTTTDVYQRIVVIREEIDSNLKMDIAKLLLGAESTVEGKALLKHLAEEGEMNKFGEFTPSVENAFDDFEPLVDVIEKEIIK